MFIVLTQFNIKLDSMLVDIFEYLGFGLTLVSSVHIIVSQLFHFAKLLILK